MEGKIQELLQEVWDICQKARVVDDQEIIEYIAAQLLEMQGKAPINQALQPRRPPTRYGIDEEDLKIRLREASRLIDNDFGKLFDRQVLFHSSRTAQKGSYPIPRHIIDFMLDMLNSRPGESFADFACGSGSFLVHEYQRRHGAVSQGKLVGVDIAPTWTRIAVANVVLNGLPEVPEEYTEIFNDDAFHICGPGGILDSREFDAIAMAPSFGKAADEKAATAALEQAGGNSNESLFTRLMLQKLRRSGKGIIMVPDGLLSRRADRELRKMLVKKHTLRAVISLQSGMLYPFNDERVGLILVQKHPLPTPPQTWFFRIEQDGYRLTRSRDVTEAPTQTSDMPLIAAAMNHPTSDFYHIYLKQSGMTTNLQALHVKWLSRSKGRDFLGMLLGIPERSEIISIELVSKPMEERHYLVSEVKIADLQTTFITLPLAQKSVSLPDTEEQFASREECLAKVYAPETPDFSQISARILFRGGKSGQLLVFSPDGRLLGVSRPSVAIAESEYNLHPDQYIPRPTIRETESPEPSTELVTSTETSVAKTLSDLKKRQSIIRDYADNLLGQVEMRPLIGEQLPPRVASGLLSDGYCTLTSLLDARQERIWRHICSYQTHEDQAVHFTVETLQKQLETAQLGADKIDRVSMQQTLDLLVRLGLIVRVNVRGAGKEPVQPYYRLVTEQEQPAERE